jgi:hypothetical protein
MGDFSSGMTYVLNQSTLVLEGVTLAQVVELVVEVLVDLAGGTVADEETTENTHAAHPEDLAISRKVYQHLRPRRSSLLDAKSIVGLIRDEEWCAYLGIRASLVPLRLPRPR